MQLLFDFFPILAFFITYKFYGIFTATIVIIAASAVQILVHWLRTRSINKMHVASALLVTLFGGITLYLQNKLYIQWKPSVLYWLFASAFLASQFFGEKMIIERMLDHAFKLERSAWKTLNMMWVAFFLVMGFVNLYVVYNYDENTWVNFKLFGFLGLTLAFALLQGFWLNGKVEAHAEPGTDETIEKEDS